MTTYAAELSGVGNTTLTVGVRAVTYPIKILRIEITIGTIAGTYTITEYSAATLSAGSAITPYPLRGGAPAASATARSGAPTGTSTVLSFSGAAVPIGTQVTYSPPASLVVPTGSAIGATTQFGALMIIYFVEQRLQGGF